MRLHRLVLTVTLVGLVVGLAGCSDGDGDGATDASSASSTPPPVPAGWPTLITQPEPQDGGMDALVGGVLGVNAQGCVVIDDKEVVIAPYGSKVVEDGKTFDLTGMGRFRIGESVRGAGGHGDAQPGNVPAFLERCFPDTGTASFVTIRGGG